MFWVVVFLVLALAGLAVLVGYAVWLAHRTADMLSEVGVLTERAAQLGDLLAQIQVREPTEPDSAPGGRRGTTRSDPSAGCADVG